mmetsp:Transcript_9882/g.29940  ORF Transcript_9882/g.29940 Transcript_9882/m.29940 type:complete len:116 (-) Transcript_9882:51-398(-)
MTDLWREFADLRILAFPCNQFGAQEPRPAAEVERSVRETYGVQFDVMEKVDVNGPAAHPVFKFLKAATATPHITWNFGVYFLVSKAGAVSAHPNVNPSQLKEPVRFELAKHVEEL